jgi:hypothetical protein
MIDETLGWGGCGPAPNQVQCLYYQSLTRPLGKAVALQASGKTHRHNSSRFFLLCSLRSQWAEASEILSIYAPFTKVKILHSCTLAKD